MRRITPIALPIAMEIGFARGMVKLSRVLPVLGAALVGCAQPQQGTTLSDLTQQYGAPTVEIVANGQLNVLLAVPTTQDCPMLSAKLTATYDGAPMQVSRGGYDQTSNSCYPIAFWFNAPPMAAIDGFEKTTNSTQLQLADESATWHVQTSKLFADNFVDDTANHRVIWADVSSITSAELSPSQSYTISGNAVVYAPDSHVDWISARTHPAATTCDGPGLCTVDLQASRTLHEQTP